MLYDYLYEFAVTAQAGSFTEAARTLSLSQPVLSRHIKMLELDLGVQLFDRKPHGVEMTETGRQILYKVLDIIDIGDRIRELAGAQPSAARVITVAGNTWLPVSARYFTQCLYETGLEMNKPLSLRFVSPDEVSTLCEALDRGIYDLYVALEDPTLEDLGSEYRKKLLFRCPWVAYVDKNHPLANRKEISLTDLKGFTITRAGGKYLNADYGWTVIKRRCEEAGFSPIAKTFAFSTLEDVYSLDLQDGVCVIGAGTEVSDILKNRGYVEIPIEGQFGNHVAVFKAGDTTVKKIVDRFVDTFDNSVFYG